MKKSYFYFLVVILLGGGCQFCEERNVSIIGKVSQAALTDFTLKKDTLLVQKNLKGYDYEVDSFLRKGDEKRIITNAEIYDNYPNGKLRETLYFCTATLDNRGFRISINGSPNHSAFSRILTLRFVDSFAIADCDIWFENRVNPSCRITTDSLSVKLSKYPVAKGDSIRGYLIFKATKNCFFQEENNRVVRETLNYDGFFECKVE